jgi:hypothetical protein
MGIADLRVQLTGVPGIERLVMRYEDGGKTQVFMIDDKEARVGATASAAEIKNALLKAIDRE